MAVLTVQQIARTGLTISAGAAAAAAGDSFANNGKRFLRVVNANGAATRTVTIASQIPTAAIPQGAALSNLAVVVPISGEKWIGPFDPAYFNDANGRVVFTYSSEADLTVAAYDLS